MTPKMVASVVPLKLTPAEEAQEDAEEQQALLSTRDYMPAFLSPKPVYFEKFWSPRPEVEGNRYKLVPKHDLTSRYETSYRSLAVREMQTRIQTKQSTHNMFASRPQMSQRQMSPRPPPGHRPTTAPHQLRESMEDADITQLRERARFGVDATEIDAAIESSPDPKAALQDLIVANRSSDEEEVDEKEVLFQRSLVLTGAENDDEKLDLLLHKALALDHPGIDRQGIKTMKGFVESGKFPHSHFINMWWKRLEDMGVVIGTREEVTAKELAGSFSGLAYLRKPKKSKPTQMFKLRGSTVPKKVHRSKLRPLTDEFNNVTTTNRWEYAKERRDPELKLLGHPYDKGFVVMVRREHCTAFVDVAPGMTPRQLMDQLRNEPPHGKPFDRLRLGRFLGIKCPARLTRGPYVLDEDTPLEDQKIGVRSNLSLVYEESLGTFDLSDPALVAAQKEAAKQHKKHFSRRTELVWGLIGQPDVHVVAQDWFQELLAQQKRLDQREALLRTASGMGLLQMAQGGALSGKKKGKGKKGGKKKKGK